ncbi:MAG: hypothetical protein MPJ82_02125 [Alphaproteobacteria bacterium]|nr:hypothetical protein [Alphaproteobacteria bacterium]
MTTINDNNPAAFHCPLSSSSPSTRTQRRPSTTTTPPPSIVSTFTINLNAICDNNTAAVTITLALDYDLRLSPLT